MTAYGHDLPSSVQLSEVATAVIAVTALPESKSCYAVNDSMWHPCSRPGTRSANPSAADGLEFPVMTRGSKQLYSIEGLKMDVRAAKKPIGSPATRTPPWPTIGALRRV